jgi:hypothetical protein
MANSVGFWVCSLGIRGPKSWHGGDAILAVTGIELRGFCGKMSFTADGHLPVDLGRGVWWLASW